MTARGLVDELPRFDELDSEDCRSPGAEHALASARAVLARSQRVLSDDVWTELDQALRSTVGHWRSALVSVDPERPVARIEASGGAGAPKTVPLSSAAFGRWALRAEFVREIARHPLAYAPRAREGRTELERTFADLGAGSFVIVPIASLDEREAEEALWLCVAWEQPDATTPERRRACRAFADALAPYVPAAVARARHRRANRVLAELPSALIGIGPRARVVDANRRARQLVGEDVLGRSLPSLFMAIDRPVVLAMLSSPAASESVVLHLEVEPAQIIPVDLFLGAAPEQPDEVRYAHVTDARARLANEREYEQRAATLSFVAELSELFAGELDAPHGFERAVSLLREYVPNVGVAIARANPEGTPVGLVGAWGVPPTALARLLAVRVRPHEEVSPEDHRAIADKLPPGHVVRVRSLRAGEAPVGVALFTREGPIEENADALLDLATRTFAVALRAANAIESVRALDAERTQLLDAVPVWVFRLDPATGETVYVNGAVQRGIAVADHGAPGIRGLLADAAEHERLARAVDEAVSSGVSAWVDLRFRGPRAKLLVLRTRLYRVSDARADRALVEGIAQDVTDELETRKQLVHTDRLASLGVLAAGVAHEINNPAAFIMLGIQQLGRMVQQLPDADPASGARARMAEIVSDLSDGVQRISQIVGELKLFARIPESAVSTPVDVNRLMTSAVTLTQAVVKPRARLELDLGDLPALPGDHARLGQVFVNLLVNAAQAIPPGAAERNVVRVQTREESGGVVVRVSDTGVGIAQEHLSRVFDPFFTTKGPGDGTGLGLAISMDLVRRAGGTIEVDSELAVGTTFTIRLPFRSSSTSQLPPQPKSIRAPSGGRVLVVEDEQALAVALSRGLSPRFHVEHAADGVLALERLSRDAAPFYDAVLCDLRIPGMDGQALYDAVRAARPEQSARFVFLTGGPTTEAHAEFLRECSQPVLEKPFAMEQLDEALAQIIADPAETE